MFICYLFGLRLLYYYFIVELSKDIVVIEDLFWELYLEKFWVVVKDRVEDYIEGRIVFFGCEDGLVFL